MLTGSADDAGTNEGAVLFHALPSVCHVRGGERQLVTVGYCEAECFGLAVVSEITAQRWGDRHALIEVRIADGDGACAWTADVERRLLRALRPHGEKWRECEVASVSYFSIIVADSDVAHRAAIACTDVVEVGEVARVHEDAVKDVYVATRVFVAIIPAASDACCTIAAMSFDGSVDDADVATRGCAILVCISGSDTCGTKASRSCDGAVLNGDIAHRLVLAASDASSIADIIFHACLRHQLARAANGQHCTLGPCLNAGIAAAEPLHVVRRAVGQYDSCVAKAGDTRMRPQLVVVRYVAPWNPHPAECHRCPSGNPNIMKSCKLARQRHAVCYCQVADDAREVNNIRPARYLPWYVVFVGARCHAQHQRTHNNHPFGYGYGQPVLCPYPFHTIKS